MPNAALALLLLPLAPRACVPLLEGCSAQPQGAYDRELHIRDSDNEVDVSDLALMQKRVSTSKQGGLGADGTAGTSLQREKVHMAKESGLAVNGKTGPDHLEKAPGAPAVREVRRALLGNLQPAGDRSSKRSLYEVAAFLAVLMVLLSLSARVHPQLASVARAVRAGGYYIIISSVMIESNKWLMQPDRFPYPFVLTFNHMLTCTVLAQLMRKLCPWAFPALQDLQVTPGLCLKFMSLGLPFMLSTVCGNWAYQYLSVSFLQIMKQTNVVTIYVLSAIAGLEALRRCSTILLVTVLAGAMMAVHGEMHFVLRGFVLQIVSSWSEATKVVTQSVLMSGQAKLDPLTMILFMAPACFVANLIPCAIVDGGHLGEVAAHFIDLWPVVLCNMLLAFALNLAVAQCIKELSAVGFLLCGIVKDNCIIITSTFFLGESLTHLQRTGFTIALAGVFLYSMYKRNLDCFKDDCLIEGFANVYRRTRGLPMISSTKSINCRTPFKVKAESSTTAGAHGDACKEAECKAAAKP